MIDVWYATADSARRNGSARTLARILLGDVLGIAPEQVPIRRRCPRCGSSDHGKPFVAGHPIEFSASSAGDRIAVALGDVPLGVDIVDVRDVSLALAGVILSAAERAGGVRGLATVWARKEAILKATGDGLALAPQTVTVSPPDAPPALLSWPRGRTDGVHLVDVPVDAQGRSVSSVAWLSAHPTPVTVHADATDLLRG